jgi:biotin carboxylase
MKIAVVDGHSTGRALVAALRNRGISCVHVQSSRDMAEYFLRGFNPNDYEATLDAPHDPARLAARLAGLGVDRVVAGTESGVLLADRISHLMKLPGHRPETAAARRDKTLMAAAVAAAGLAVPLGRAFRDAGAAAAWFTDTGQSEAVVKPPSSAGSDNVRFCRTADEVHAAAAAVLAAGNLYGEPNHRAVVQERLRGVEYYINSVSHDGEHRIAEIWRYSKRVGAAGTPTYDYEDPVEARSAEAARLVAFVKPVLDALGVVSGAAHTEVMVTRSGPVLIETGARLGGATLPRVIEKYCGVSQTSLLADTLADPARLAEFDDSAVRWSQAVRNVSLTNHRAGLMRSLDWTARIEALPTFAALAHSVEPGAWLGETTSLIDSPGYVYLASADLQDVERDYAELRRMELGGLYTD